MAQTDLLRCAQGMERHASLRFSYGSAIDSDADGVGDMDAGPVNTQCLHADVHAVSHRPGGVRDRRIPAPGERGTAGQRGGRGWRPRTRRGGQTLLGPRRGWRIRSGRGQVVSPGGGMGRCAPGRRTIGVTLTETLVAILVMSSGALGLAALQAESLRAGREAWERSVAVQRAADMLDRIRANRAVPAVEFTVGRGAPVFQDCLSGACGAREMARFDLAAWKCGLGAWRDDAACVQIREAGGFPGADATPGLPEGDGTVVVRSGEIRAMWVTVTVSWRPPGRTALA